MRVNRLKKVSEGLVNVSGEKFVVFRLYIVHVVVLFGDGSRIKSCRSVPPNVSSGVLSVQGGVSGRSRT